MSVLLQVRSLTHTVGGKLLFEDLDLAVNRGERLGLVGHNGSGKTTLLHILAGRISPDQGERTTRTDLTVSLVEQFLPETLSSLNLVDAVADRAVDGADWRAEALLSQLGFNTAEFGLQVGALSGGQQNRLMFARALVADPDLLLLDEPTNHLDLETMLLFEQVLTDSRAAFVLISHDRAFLDTVTTHTLFLRDQRAWRFASSYSSARADLDAQDAAAAETRASEERKIEAVRASAKRLATWGKVYDNEKFARRARNMERRVERMERDRTFVTSGSPLDLSLSLGETRAKQVVAVEDCAVDVADRHLFAIDDLLIRPGERVVLLGHNGVGKSTFIRRLVAARDANDAPIRYSGQTSVGYYDQELDEVSGAESMHDYVANRVDASTQNIVSTLVHAGFAYADHTKRVENLSGGERARLRFIVLAMNEPNFLILDEPTNHIDLEGKEQLEEQLLASGATLLITSHDRRFIERLGQRFLLIEAGALTEWQDLEQAMSRLSASAGASESLDRPDPSPAKSSVADDLLERIVELEELLAADRARKAKFQKPRLQAEWQAELDRLNKQLDERE